jgi:hypothetical protein
VNAAPKEVLMAVPGMDPGKVDALMIQRKAAATTATTGTTGSQGVQGSQGIQDLAAILGEKTPASGAFLSTDESNVFSIEAIGNREGTPQGYGIRAIVTVEGTAAYRYLYYKSPAQVEP